MGTPRLCTVASHVLHQSFNREPTVVRFVHGLLPESRPEAVNTFAQPPDDSRLSDCKIYEYCRSFELKVERLELQLVTSSPWPRTLSVPPPASSTTPAPLPDAVAAALPCFVPSAPHRQSHPCAAVQVAAQQSHVLNLSGTVSHFHTLDGAACLSKFLRRRARRRVLTIHLTPHFRPTPSLSSRRRAASPRPSPSAPPLAPQSSPATPPGALCPARPGAFPTSGQARLISFQKAGPPSVLHWPHARLQKRAT